VKSYVLAECRAVGNAHERRERDMINGNAAVI